MDLRLLFKVLQDMRRLRLHEKWTRDDLETFQREELSHLREWACARSPFYRDFHRGLSNAPLRELPILTKSMMMEHFDAIVTDRRVQLPDVRAHLAAGGRGRFRKGYEVVTTSGSTGTPGIFLFDPREWTTIIASFARAREWAGLRLRLTGRSRMAVVSSTNERNLSARVGRVADTPFLPTLRLDATEPLADIVAALNRWQPEVLVAYASMANVLAGEQAIGRLTIHPRAVFASSEVLTAQMRQRLTEAWGEVVFDEYASTETASIAAEDTAHHGMHVFEDLLIVENVDAGNQPVPPGTFGEKILVSVLFSRTQPLIRYEISDNVRFAATEPGCHLPFRTIDGVQGRSEDILLLPGESNQVVRVHPNVFHDAMDLVPSDGWQVVQEPDGLRILVVPGVEPLDDLRVRDLILAALGSQGVLPLSVRVERVSSIPKAPSGKTPLIKGLFPPPHPNG
ncbi:MAG: phenylacetate--CoA ligase family protein [Chloroflexi bacterium]|nr:phenylacetate--CoA ligase family protein [Chloroflexota bacterium]